MPESIADCNFRRTRDDALDDEPLSVVSVDAMFEATKKESIIDKKSCEKVELQLYRLRSKSVVDSIDYRRFEESEENDEWPEFWITVV